MGVVMGKALMRFLAPYAMAAAIAVGMSRYLTAGQPDAVYLGVFGVMLVGCLVMMIDAVWGRWLLPAPPTSQGEVFHSGRARLTLLVLAGWGWPLWYAVGLQELRYPWSFETAALPILGFFALLPLILEGIWRAGMILYLRMHLQGESKRPTSPTWASMRVLRHLRRARAWCRDAALATVLAQGFVTTLVFGAIMRQEKILPSASVDRIVQHIWQQGSVQGLVILLVIALILTLGVVDDALGVLTRRWGTPLRASANGVK